MTFTHKLFPGKMRHRISLAVPSGMQDSTGAVPQTLSSWKTVLTCWAKIDAMNGKDQEAASSYVSSVSHQIIIRYPRGIASQITNACVVWFNKRTFQVMAVLNPNETNKMLVLLCTEINNSAQQVPTPRAA